MAQYPWFSWNVESHLAETQRLTTLEIGAYDLLLDAMWIAGGKLPADDRTLARCAKMSTSHWVRIKPAVLALMRIEDGFVTNDRLLHELSRIEQKSRKQAERAKSRWSGQNNSGTVGPEHGSKKGPEHGFFVDPHPASNPLKNNDAAYAAAYTTTMPPTPTPTQDRERERAPIGAPHDADSGGKERGGRGRKEAKQERNLTLFSDSR